MAMGSTGTVNITPEMMRNALKVIEEYRTTVGNYNTELETTVNGLIPSSFNGAAANGFKGFYVDNIKPATEDGMTKLLDSLQKIVEETSKAIPDTDGLDDQLGEGNNKKQ